MKSKLQITAALLVALCAALVSFADALAQEEWNQTYGGRKSDYGYSVEQTKDGGFIIAGRTYSTISGSSEGLIIKTDSQGIRQWHKVFGGSKSDYLQCIRQTADGGYIVVGKTYSFGQGECDVWLIKTDDAGNEVWSRTYGGAAADAGNSVWQTTDGGYIIAGKTYSYGAGQCDAWLIKTDVNGNALWNKLFGGIQQDSGRCVQQTTDGGYIIAGYTGSSGEGNWDSWLIKTNASGQQQWQVTSGGTGTDGSYSVQQTADGGYVTAGFKESVNTGYDVYVIKVGSAGAPVWKQVIGGSKNDYGMSVRQTTDGGYIVTGYTYSIGAGEADVWLIKMDAKGAQVWNRTFGGAAIDAGRCVREISAGQYIIAGYAASYGAGERDVWLIKALTPELAHINLSSPLDQLTVSSPPTFKWTSGGGSDNAYSVDLSLSPDFVDCTSSYEDLHQLVREPLWKMPTDTWQQYAPGSQIYWRVRGTDLNLTPQTIITSDEVWSFRKQ
jgi:hypothetical protein